MKSSVTRQTIFTPVSINITLETPEELSLFSQLMMANVRIPDMLKEDKSIKPEDKYKLTELMSQIYRGDLQRYFSENPL